jgi:8-oxo-dGTP diphosphatase
MQKVTAGVIEKDGKILIARRKDGKCLGAEWEFPGGKLEPFETLQECLKRELKEELDIETEIGEFICSSNFTCDNKNIELMAYKVAYLSGEVKLTDHDKFCWVSPEELKNYKFVEPDLLIVEKIILSIHQSFFDSHKP